MILAVIVLALAQADVTLAAVERLPPSAAGDLVLSGKDHGAIQRLARAPAHVMDPPGWGQVDLFEPAVATPAGCTRRRWVATFMKLPGEEEATLRDSYVATDVAMARAGRCPGGRYIHVNPGLEASEALATLADLDAVVAGRRKVEVSCRDVTKSGLCRDNKTILRELARLPRWAVTRDEGDMVVLMGVRDQAVTRVRFPAGSPGQVEVSRAPPLPF